MHSATPQEIDNALAVAADHINGFGDIQLLAKLALNQQLRLQQLEKLVGEVEHYLDSGQDASTHAQLLRDIRYYHANIQPPLPNKDQAFGLE